MTDKIDFTVVGNRKINCSGCETNISFALQRIPGIQEVAADSKTQRVAINFDPLQVSIEQVQAKLKEIGFEVEKTAP